jgi:hypothetical protein
MFELEVATNFFKTLEHDEHVFCNLYNNHPLKIEIFNVFLVLQTMIFIHNIYIIVSTMKIHKYNILILY